MVFHVHCISRRCVVFRPVLKKLADILIQGFPFAFGLNAAELELAAACVCDVKHFNRMHFVSKSGWGGLGEVI